MSATCAPECRTHGFETMADPPINTEEVLARRQMLGRLGAGAAAVSTAFPGTGLGHPRDVSLMPYYRIAHERYNLDWKLVKPGDVAEIEPHSIS